MTKRKNNRFTSWIAIIAMMLTALPIYAQEQTSAIQGTVTDSSGAALPGVTVEASNDAGTRLTAYTDANGNYRFPSVRPGTYTVTAKLEGLGDQSTRVVAGLGVVPRADLTLAPQQISTTITVTGDAPIVDTTSSATSTSIRSETFEKLPKGRDFTTVVTQAASANNESKSGGISIDGASASENRFVLDGVDTTHPRTGTTGKTVITDFVDEVQVKSAGYAAEFGGAVGGVINVITKTGTNDFSGSAYGYATDNGWGGGDERPVLTTNDDGTLPEYLSLDADDEQTLEPGFTIGGPILRDRLWFFGGYNPIMQDIERTATFSNGSTGTFVNEFQRDNYVANLSGSVGSRLLYKAVYNSSGYEDEGVLPSRLGTDSATGRYTGLGTELENWTGSGYADFIASPQWLFSARGGRFYSNISQFGIPTDHRVRFISGSNNQYLPEGHPARRNAGFASAPSNSATVRDEFIRDNAYLDGSWYPTFAGSHSIKAGAQFEYLDNSVLSGFQNYNVLAFWNSGTRFTNQRGEFGAAEVYTTATAGDVTSENVGLFLQDSWTTMNDRLTLNLGVRAESEKVPSYADPAAGLRETAIEFDYGDKFAPRLGFAYDIFGNNRWKAYGSYGRFFDITKLEMPRGSFGGDKWINWQFAINDPDWTKWACTNVTNSQADVPVCTGGLSLIKADPLPDGYIDLRHPSLDLIEPDLKPMESQEMTLGLQHELSSNMGIGLRLTQKELIRTIEDVGILRNGAEEYFIANPGFGVATDILAETCPACPSVPEAKREYTAAELEFTKRFSNRWALHASYLYSELEGNYAGLSNSDEATTGLGRTSPNVNRAFDSLFNLYDASGNAVEGKLATDRPHQVKAQLTYAFPFGTSVGLNQYYGSGTPITTEIAFHGVPVMPFGRGDLGRTSSLTSTDLYLQHAFKIFGDYGLSLGVNVLNLFDEDTATDVYKTYTTLSVPMFDANGDIITDETEEYTAFFQGFDAFENYDRINDIEGESFEADPRYGSDVFFQAPRSVRFDVRFTF